MHLAGHLRGDGRGADGIGDVSAGPAAQVSCQVAAEVQPGGGGGGGLRGECHPLTAPAVSASCMRRLESEYVTYTGSSVSTVPAVEHAEVGGVGDERGQCDLDRPHVRRGAGDGQGEQVLRSRT